LLRRHLRDGVRRQIRGMLAAGAPGAGLAAAAALRLAQRASGRLAYHQRRAVLRNDIKLDESLGFAAEG
jgi:hypothetical protein